MEKMLKEQAPFFEEYKAEAIELINKIQTMIPAFGETMVSTSSAIIKNDSVNGEQYIIYGPSDVGGIVELLNESFGPTCIVYPTDVTKNSDRFVELLMETWDTRDTNNEELSNYPSYDAGMLLDDYVVAIILSKRKPSNIESYNQSETLH